MQIKNKLSIKNNLSLIIFIFISAYFFLEYLEISKENPVPSYDELGYLDEGIHLRNISYDFREIINRNRTPLLPLIISFLAQNKGLLIQFTPEYIALYRETQIAIISIVFIISFFLYFKFKKLFNTDYLLIFFFIYFYNVPLKSQIELVLVEPILMCLYLLFITTLFEIMDSSSNKDFILLGIIGGFLFLAKYTGFLIFVFTLLSLLIYKTLILKNKNFRVIFGNLIISFTAFCTVGLPYIIANISDNLNPFYSVNSKIMWYSNWPEAYDYIKQYDGNFGFKNIPENLYPSFSYFLRNNGGINGLMARLKRGFNILRDDAISFDKLLGLTNVYILVLFVLILFTLIFVYKKIQIKDYKKNLYEIIFLFTLTALLLFGFLLYSAMAMGERFYLYTSIPIMYYLFYLLDSLFPFLGFKGKNKLFFNTLVIFSLIYVNLIIYDVFWFLLHPLGFIKSLLF